MKHITDRPKGEQGIVWTKWKQFKDFIKNEKGTADVHKTTDGGKFSKQHVITHIFNLVKDPRNLAFINGYNTEHLHGDNKYRALMTLIAKIYNEWGLTPIIADRA